jgi:hypothetical protein
MRSEPSPPGGTRELFCARDLRCAPKEIGEINDIATEIDKGAV